MSPEFYRIPTVPFLYPILDSSLSSNLLQDAADILRAGARILQIRAKNKDRRFVYDAVQGLIPLAQEHRVPLLVNDYVDVVLVTEASGVHIGQTDLPPDVCRRLLPDRVIGFSTHTMEQFLEANQMPVDYVAVGPVFESTTRISTHQTLGIGGVLDRAVLKKKPVVCIGGIQAHHFKELLSTGVDGIAVISELYRAGSLYDSTRRFLDLMSES